MKTAATTNSLARIYRSSSVGIVGASKYFAPHEPLSGLARAGLLCLVSPGFSRARLRTLGTELAAIARHARFLRQMELVEWASDAILALPLPSEFQSVGHYYQAYCQQERGEFEGSRITLTRVAAEAPAGYRERAILELGLSHWKTGELGAAAQYYVEAAKAARGTDPLVHLAATWDLAILRGVDGDRRGALRDLEQLRPALAALGQQYPAYYCDFLNSLAVEMSAVGRNQQAKQIISRLLALPIAERYPSWRETAVEIADNEARGVSCPLTFAIGSPASLKPAGPEPLAVQKSNSNEDHESKSAAKSDGLAGRRIAHRSSGTLRQFEPLFATPAFRSHFMLPGAAAGVEAAAARAANIPRSALGLLSGRRRYAPCPLRCARRVRNRQPESVPVPGEYPRFPLPRAPTPE